MLSEFVSAKILHSLVKMVSPSSDKKSHAIIQIVNEQGNAQMCYTFVQILNRTGSYKTCIYKTLHTFVQTFSGLLVLKHIFVQIVSELVIAKTSRGLSRLVVLTPCVVLSKWLECPVVLKLFIFSFKWLAGARS